jgi:hypothetical protein
MNTTQCNKPIEPLTIEDIKKASLLVFKKKEPDLPKGLGWFTKLMNRFGWHRRYEVIVMDKSQFIVSYPPVSLHKQ